MCYLKKYDFQGVTIEELREQLGMVPKAVFSNNGTMALEVRSLGGEVRADLESVLGAQTEKMISDMYFDKAFIGANGYIPDGGIYTYDDREARKKAIVKEHSKKTYALMDTSKKNKYAFSKVFDLSEVELITEED